MFLFVQVLIVGGGDGGVARECAKHPKVENITMIEIDQVCLRLGWKFIIMSEI